MALKDGHSAAVEINGKDLSAYVTNLVIDLKGRDLVDVTAMGATGHQFASNELADASVTVDFLFDDTPTDGSWEVLEAIFDGTEKVNLDIRPNGVGSFPLITGYGWIETLPIVVAIADLIRMTGVVFRFHGAPTVTPKAP